MATKQEQEQKKKFGGITGKLMGSYGLLFKLSATILDTWFNFFKSIPNFNFDIYEQAIDEFILNNKKPPSVNDIANLYHTIASKKAAEIRKSLYCKICKGKGMIFFKPRSSDYQAAAKCTCPAGHRYTTLATIPKYAIDEILKAEKNSA